MTLLRAVLLTALVALYAVRLQADPQVIINDPPGPCTPVGLSFTFISDGAGGGTVCFSNGSGQDWSFLEVNVPMPMPPELIISCGGTAFAVCEVQLVTEGNFATIDFSGGSAGILNGANFTIDLGPSGWTPNATFEAFANEPDEPEPVPEPGTMRLFLIGLPALLGRRMRRSHCGISSR